MSLVALALLVSLAVVAGSIAFLAVRSLALWRTVRAFTGGLGADIARLADSLERLAEREPADVERLTLAIARMRASQERLSILTGALGRVGEQWSALLALVPRK